MTTTAMFIAALILLPAVGLAAWAWFAMARVEQELLSFSGFEGMHFESVPNTAEATERAR